MVYNSIEKNIANVRTSNWCSTQHVCTPKWRIEKCMVNLNPQVKYSWNSTLKQRSSLSAKWLKIVKVCQVVYAPQRQSLLNSFVHLLRKFHACIENDQNPCGSKLGKMRLKILGLEFVEYEHSTWYGTWPSNFFAC